MSNLEWRPGAPIMCVRDIAENLFSVMLAIEHGYDLPKPGEKYLIATVHGCGAACCSLELREIQHPLHPTFCRQYFALIEPASMVLLREALTPVDGDPVAPVKVDEPVDG